MKTTISLCIIAKNEAELIGQCIKSALPYVDQVVVVDTGSSDRTQEIAKNLGAEIWDFPWNNDFSTARNFSLEKARSDWILFMDCDEEIDHSTGEIMLEAVKSDYYHAYYIIVNNLLAGNNHVSFHSIRLFRNLPQYRFKGKIHEQISYSIVANCGEEKISRIGFTLLHHGYNPEKVNIQAKITRNVFLLKEQQGNLEDKDGFFLYNIGIEYVRQGKFQEALENFIKSLKFTKSAAGYAPPLVNKTIVCLIEMKRYRDALEQLAYFQTVYPDYSDLYLLEAACHIRCGRFSLACENIEKASMVSNNNINYPVEGTIFGQKPALILSNYQNLRLADQKKFRLSICILANNVEKNIARCLAGVNELADEIILVTTGCNDNTLNIAYQMGASIYRLNWDNSYAKLRNFALNQATGDWILFLNGEEEVQQTDLKTLVNCLNKSQRIAFKLKVKSFFDIDNWSLYQEEAICKVFINNKELNYRSCLLEDIEQSIPNHCRNNNIGYIPLTIYDYSHLLKTHLKTVSFKRNVSLIVQDFKNIGKNNSVYEVMGNEFMKMNKFKAALGHFEKALLLSNYQAPASLWYKAITCYYKLGNFVEALKLVKEARENYPDFTNIIYLQGYCYLKLDYLEDAEKCFTRCLELGEAPWERYIVQPGAGSYLAQCGLAEVYLEQGKLKKCLEQYQAAAHYSEGKSYALPLLTKIIIENQGAEGILHYFEENFLVSCENLCLAADTANKNGCFIVSLELLSAAAKQMQEEKKPALYELISRKMFDFLGDLYTDAIKYNPHDPHLQNLKYFFKDS